MRMMSKEVGVSRESVRRIVKKLGMRSYRLSRGHLLKGEHKQRRLEKAVKLRKLVTGKKLERVLFSDEKVFTVMRHHNRQNDRVILKKGTKQSRVLVQRVQKAASVMVWAGICATGRTKLHFVEEGIRLNSAGYQRVLRKVGACCAARANAPRSDAAPVGEAPLRREEVDLPARQRPVPHLLPRHLQGPEADEAVPRAQGAQVLVDRRVARGEPRPQPDGLLHLGHPPGTRRPEVLPQRRRPQEGPQEAVEQDPAGDHPQGDRAVPQAAGGVHRRTGRALRAADVSGWII